ELATGRCLTSDDRKLFAQPISEEAKAASEAAGGGSLPASADLRAFRDDSCLIRDRCSHCWYDPKRKI
ncbi:MAG: hypothetical protein KGO05_03150, partial [Chloroflexota bacterium]|nr:hypothetical protein [Chloroflexota bacterium]